MLLAPRRGLVALGALAAFGGLACSKDYDAFLQGGTTTTTSSTGTGGAGIGGASSGGGGTGGVQEGGGGAGGSLPPALWAEAVTGAMPGGAGAFAVAADGEGNVFVTGRGVAPLELDGKPIAGCTATAAFVAKIAASGLPVWRRCFDATKGSVGQKIVLDAQGNVFVAGSFNGDISFGATTYAAGSVDGFVVELDPSGEPIWSKWIEGSGNTWVSGLAAAGDAVIVSGAFTQALKIDSTTLPGSGPAQLYVARLAAADGTLAWVKSFGDSGNDAGPLPAGTAKALLGGVAATAALDIYLIASFDTDFFLPDVGSLVGHSGGSQFDTYVLHLSAAGEVLHHRFWGSNGKEEQGRAVAVDPATGNVFFTGIFDGDIDFGGGVLSPEARDAYLVELDPSLGHVWSSVLGGPDVQDAFAVAVEGSSVLVGGMFKNTLTLGAGPSFTAGTGEEAFVARFEPGTANANATVIGPGGNDQTFGVAFAAGAAAAAGAFEQTVTIGGKDLTSPEGEAGFVARMATP